MKNRVWGQLGLGWIVVSGCQSPGPWTSRTPADDSRSFRELYEADQAVDRARSLLDAVGPSVPQARGVQDPNLELRRQRRRELESAESNYARLRERAAMQSRGQNNFASRTFELPQGYPTEFTETLEFRTLAPYQTK